MTSANWAILFARPSRAPCRRRDMRYLISLPIPATQGVPKRSPCSRICAESVTASSAITALRPRWLKLPSSTTVQRTRICGVSKAPVLQPVDYCCRRTVSTESRLDIAYHFDNDPDGSDNTLCLAGCFQLRSHWPTTVPARRNLAVFAVAELAITIAFVKGE